MRARGSEVTGEPEQASPWKLGGLSVWELLKRTYHEVSTDEVADRAAGLSYYFLFALFPTLLFLTALLSLLPIPDLMDRLMTYLASVLPGDAASLVEKTLGEITKEKRTGLLSIGALAALWAASAGVASMMNALNVAYDVEDKRPWWKRRAIAIALTLVMSLLVLSAMVLLVFGGTIGGVIGLGDLAVKIWMVVQWPVAIGFVVLAIALLYYGAPAVEHRRWYWVTPGSLFATAAWIVMSIALRFYVSNFADYNATYGSIGGVILLMLWLYLGGLVILTGAEINSEIEHAAAMRGTQTAKARGERAPGDASTARAEATTSPAAVERKVARISRRLPPDPGDVSPEATAERLGATLDRSTAAVADAARQAGRGAVALPWVAAWGAGRLIARATSRLAGRPLARRLYRRSDRAA